MKSILMMSAMIIALVAGGSFAFAGDHGPGMKQEKGDHRADPAKENAMHREARAEEREREHEKEKKHKDKYKDNDREHHKDKDKERKHERD